MARESAALVVLAQRVGGELLPDNDQWQNRMEIRSSSSSKLYVVAQRKSDLSWGCNCQGWKRWRHCHHLDTMVPLLEAAVREELRRLPS